MVCMIVSSASYSAVNGDASMPSGRMAAMTHIEFGVAKRPNNSDINGGGPLVRLNIESQVKDQLHARTKRTTNGGTTTMSQLAHFADFLSGVRH